MILKRPWSGTHTPYLDHPRELTQAIRPFLRQVSTVPA